MGDSIAGVAMLRTPLLGRGLGDFNMTVRQKARPDPRLPLILMGDWRDSDRSQMIEETGVIVEMMKVAVGS
jgi:hypothetical protein